MIVTGESFFFFYFTAVVKYIDKQRSNRVLVEEGGSKKCSKNGAYL
jgi:hypothetical protein